MRRKPGRAAFSRPSSAKTTRPTAFGSATQVITTSALSPSSRGVRGHAARPSRRAAGSAPRVRFQTAVGKPLSSRFAGHAAAHDPQARDADLLLDGCRHLRSPLGVGPRQLGRERVEARRRFARPSTRSPARTAARSVAITSARRAGHSSSDGGVEDRAPASASRRNIISVRLEVVVGVRRATPSPRSRRAPRPARRPARRRLDLRGRPQRTDRRRRRGTASASARSRARIVTHHPSRACAVCGQMSRNGHWLQARYDGRAVNSRRRTRRATSRMRASVAAASSRVGSLPPTSPDSRKRSSTRSGSRPVVLRQAERVDVELQALFRALLRGLQVVHVAGLEVEDRDLARRARSRGRSVRRPSSRSTQNANSCSTPVGSQGCSASARWKRRSTSSPSFAAAAPRARARGNPRTPTPRGRRPRGRPRRRRGPAAAPGSAPAPPCASRCRRRRDGARAAARECDGCTCTSAGRSSSRRSGGTTGSAAWRPGSATRTGSLSSGGG